jgi:hypothetical protein
MVEVDDLIAARMQTQPGLWTEFSARPYGSRVRHEDEKYSSAISMRILQTCR